MSIIINDKDYVLGIWSVDGPKGNGLLIIKRQPERRWELHWRLRYYVDDKLFEASEDPKFFHTWTMDADVGEEFMIDVAEGVCRLGVEFGIGKDVHCQLVQSSEPKAFADAIHKIPGMFSQERTVH